MVLRLRRVLRVVCLALLSVGLSAQDLTTVVLVRHAERQSIFDADSPLAEAGVHRAMALVPLLEGFRPTVLYTSDLQRTQRTLAPLAEALGLKPRVRAKDESAALAAEILQEHRGVTTIVCWHHDLMKKIARGLGVQGPIPHWPLDAYDRLWIVKVGPSGVASLEERLQVPSAPAGAGVAQGR